MTNKEMREYLSRYRDTMTEIRYKESLYNKAAEAAMHVTASGEASHGGNGDKVGMSAARMADLEAEIRNLKALAEKTNEEIYDFIHKSKLNALEKVFLTERFIECRPVREIISIPGLNYVESYGYKIIRNAIAALARANP